MSISHAGYNTSKPSGHIGRSRAVSISRVLPSASHTPAMTIKGHRRGQSSKLSFDMKGMPKMGSSSDVITLEMSNTVCPLSEFQKLYELTRKRSPSQSSCSGNQIDSQTILTNVFKDNPDFQRTSPNQSKTETDFSDTLHSISPSHSKNLFRQIFSDSMEQGQTAQQILTALSDKNGSINEQAIQNYIEKNPQFDELQIPLNEQKGTILSVTGDNKYEAATEIKLMYDHSPTFQKVTDYVSRQNDNVYAVQVRKEGLGNAIALGSTNEKTYKGWNMQLNPDLFTEKGVQGVKDSKYHVMAHEEGHNIGYKHDDDPKKEEQILRDATGLPLEKSHEEFVVRIFQELQQNARKAGVSFDFSQTPSVENAPASKTSSLPASPVEGSLPEASNKAPVDDLTSAYLKSGSIMGVMAAIAVFPLGVKALAASDLV